MKLIAINGKIGAGKDTIYTILHEHDPSIKRASFADALKLEVGRMFLGLHNLTNYQTVIDKVNADKANLRSLLQAWGETRRNADPNYWITHLLINLKSLPDNSTVVITDVRYKNEFKVLKEIGANMWRINRPMKDNTNCPNINLHISEIDLDEFKFDHEILNEFSLVYLKQTVINLYTQTIK